MNQIRVELQGLSTVAMMISQLVESSEIKAARKTGPVSDFVGLAAMLVSKSFEGSKFSAFNSGLAFLRTLRCRLPFAVRVVVCSLNLGDLVGSSFFNVGVSDASAAKINGKAKQLARETSKTIRQDPTHPTAAIKILKLTRGERLCKFVQIAIASRIHAPSKQLQPASW